jgi:hypothetical protein
MAIMALTFVANDVTKESPIVSRFAPGSARYAWHRQGLLTLISQDALRIKKAMR